MANPRPPAKLNFQDPNWDAWRSSFQTFRAETNLDQEDDEIQISTLMYSMGPESERVLSYFDTGLTRGTHDLNKSHRTYDQVLAKSNNDFGKSHRTYDEVLGKFDWYFKAKKKNLMTLRRAFQNRVQLRSENVEEFCNALKKCGMECEFVDLEERVRDQFVFGVRNKSLSEKLEQLFVINPVGYTLEKVVLAAKAFERSYSQDFLSLKPKDNRDTSSLKQRDNKDTLSHKQREINISSLKQKDVDILSLKQKDTKEKRVRSLKGSIKIMVPCPEL